MSLDNSWTKKMSKCSNEVICQILNVDPCGMPSNFLAALQPYKSHVRHDDGVQKILLTFQPSYQNKSCSERNQDVEKSSMSVCEGSRYKYREPFNLFFGFMLMLVKSPFRTIHKHPFALSVPIFIRKK